MEVQSAIDGLLTMNWADDVAPLVEFLNAAIDCTEFGHLRNEMESILQMFANMQTEDDADHLGHELEKKLQGVTNEVKIIDRAARKIEVSLVVEGVIENIWADFICIFLYRNWRDLLCQCGHCAVWFERSRKDRVWCSESCRSKAAYARHGEVRRSERRERYRAQKEGSCEI